MRSVYQRPVTSWFVMSYASELVAFSCGSRGFCPSCLGRRMCQGSLNLLTYVLPAVPLRQWVLTLPFELRAPLAYERNLMGAVARIFADSVMGWYRRRLAAGVPEARGGAVTVIQRSSSDMKLNPHLHVILVNGVYVASPDGMPNFRALPRLATDEVGDVLQIARLRILRYLARRGVVRLLPETLEMDAWEAGRLRRPRTIVGGNGNPPRVPMSDDELAERDPVLAQLAAAAVSGLPPAGPELRCRPVVQLARTDGAGPTPMGALVVQELGFNLHAASIAGAEDQPARQRLLRYVLRPRFAARQGATHPPARQPRAPGPEAAISGWHLCFGDGRALPVGASCGLGATAEVAFGSLQRGACPRESVAATGHPAAAAAGTHGDTARPVGAQ